MRTGHARYFVEFESDTYTCGSYTHFGGNANSLKSAKAVIWNIKHTSEDNPRNFKVYDTFADTDETTNFAPCVYEEK